jgi:hypothetical protein
MRTAEQNRLGSAPARLQADIQAYIAWLNTRLAALDDDLDTTWRASPVLREREELLRSVPGIGPVCARTLRLDLPELGTLRLVPRCGYRRRLMPSIRHFARLSFMSRYFCPRICVVDAEDKPCRRKPLTYTKRSFTLSNCCLW